MKRSWVPAIAKGYGLEPRTPGGRLHAALYDAERAVVAAAFALVDTASGNRPADGLISELVPKRLRELGDAVRDLRAVDRRVVQGFSRVVRLRGRPVVRKRA